MIPTGMIIVAWRKAGELPKDTLVMTVRQDGFTTTKQAIAYTKKNPNTFDKDDILEVIKPGKKFKIKEKPVQIEIEYWQGGQDG